MPDPTVQSATPWLVMGVSGSGKSTFGRSWANHLNRPFFDADDYHPARNLEKMKRGEPLDDADRRPWLDRLNRLLHEHPDAVLACSALKRSYRTRLAQNLPALRIAFLHVDHDTLKDRMESRDHFMPPGLLRSQLDTLEPPGQDEALILDGRRSIGQLLNDLRAASS